MFSQRELEVLRTMAEAGGSFVSHLAKAWMCADATNFQKLKVAFPNYWAEYERLVDIREENARQAREDGE